ncbi:hypothetical protein ACO7_180028 [Thiomonas arsenitoxydans]|nr:hypothetical protein ACO3_200010 [Thiomonas arsenitoxydans]CQR29436.1 hypothetical protein ACO7_180028 [Thiomonas arsenitoxydans]
MQRLRCASSRHEADSHLVLCTAPGRRSARAGDFAKGQWPRCGRRRKPFPGGRNILDKSQFVNIFRFCPLPYRGDWAEAERDVNPALDGSSHSGASSTGDGDALALRG